MEEVEKLWAQFGKLQARREQAVLSVQQIEQEMRKVYGDILIKEQEEKEVKKVERKPS